MPEKKSFNQKYGRILTIFAAMCAVISMVAVFLSAYVGRDPKQLYKLALPFTILVLITMIWRKNNKA